jgi:hypothetical protein
MNDGVDARAAAIASCITLSDVGEWKVLPWRRLTSSLVPVRSTSCSSATICSSVNRDFRIRSPPRRSAVSGTVNL